MRLAIIGTGNVGAAIGKGLRGKGHEVTYGTRDPLAPKVALLARDTDAKLAAPGDAARHAELVIIALPWAAAEQAVRQLGDLAGKTVVDCMNPLGMVDGALSLTVGHTTSGGEIVQSWIPNAKVVKTMNQVGAEVLADAGRFPLRPVQFVAGDEQQAKERAIRLLTDLGFAALDAGDLSKARLLEVFGMVWINQALFQGKGRNWAFAAIDPS